MSPHPMIPVPQAIRCVLTETASKLIQDGVQVESLPTTHHEALLGRIAAETIKASEKGYPPYNASIMDGYAINLDQIDHIMSLTQNREGGSDDSHADACHFHVCDKIYAGPAKIPSQDPVDIDMADYLHQLPKAIYVTTGAVIPSPYNAVIPVEEVDESEVKEHIISIDVSTITSAKHNLWIRPIGCDIKPYTPIVKKREVIEPVHIGLLAQCEIKEIQVNRLPTVGILSTGNELFSQSDGASSAESERAEGIIPDANGPALYSLLESYGNCRPCHLGIVKDNEEERLMTILEDGMKKHDVVITSGGISMGEMDIIERVLVERLGCSVHFGRLHMKPGKPTTFLTANIGGRSCLIFALPGNPVSAMVCSELLIRPCLDMINEGFIDTVSAMVQNAKIHPEVCGTLLDSVKLDKVRPEYHRVKVAYKVDEKQSIMFEATSTGIQRSSRLMSMCEADGFLLLPQGVEGIKTKTEVGDSYPLLLTKRPFGNTGPFGATKVKDSSHMRGAALTVGILEVVGSKGIDSDEENISERLLDVLDRENCMLIEHQKSNLDSMFDALRRINGCLDLLFVVAVDTSFPENLDLASELRKLIRKEAKQMASLLREGSACDEPTSALFEPVVGLCNFRNTESSCLLVSIQNEGLEGAVTITRSLLMKTIAIARGY